MTKVGTGSLNMFTIKASNRRDVLSFSIEDFGPHQLEVNESQNFVKTTIYIKGLKTAYIISGFNKNADWKDFCFDDGLNIETVLGKFERGYFTEVTIDIAWSIVSINKSAASVGLFLQIQISQTIQIL